MATKTKRILQTCLIVALSLILIVCLLFAFEAKIFDRSGWLQSEDGLRYLDYYARPQTGWVTIQGERYYFGPDDGLMRTGWQELDGRRYHFAEDGVLHTDWLDLADDRYYLGEDGIMRTGWLDTQDGRYYLNEDGVMQTGWVDTSDGRFYLNETGRMQTGWLDTNDGRYYLNESGIMYIGWLDADGARYYLDENGILQTGWLDLADDRYYLGEDGAMRTGWLSLEDDYYYFREDGAMAKGVVNIDDVDRHFSSTGKYVVVVNKWNPVPADYEVSFASINGYQISENCLEALEALMAACREAGYSCKINSAYRSKGDQQAIWNNRYNNYISSGYSKEKAEQLTRESVADPGTSEHQLGLAVDLGSGSAGYEWLAEHSWEYGFHLRYPEGKTDITGIIYEPWHFRYLGKELAKELFEAQLTVEEYMELLTEE